MAARRNLQARVLREEWERREELERLQEEQRKMLAEETKKRQEFERQQEEKDSQLRGMLLSYVIINELTRITFWRFHKNISCHYTEIIIGSVSSSTQFCR